MMYKVNGRGQRFRAVVGLDDSYEGEETARFREFNEDFFGNIVLYNSGNMKAGDAVKKIDIDISEVKCLTLTFEGKNVPGNWDNALVFSIERLEMRAERDCWVCTFCC